MVAGSPQVLPRSALISGPTPLRLRVFRRHVNLIVMRSPGPDLDALVREHGEDLLRLAYHLTGDDDRAEDLLRIALARLTLRRRPAEPRAVVVRASLTRWSPWSVARRDDGPDVIVEVSHAELDERALVLGAFQQLAPRDRAVIALQVLEDLPAHEATALLGPADLDRALQNLAARLGLVEPADPGGVEVRLRRAFKDRLTVPDGLARTAASRAHRIRWTRRAGAVVAAAAVAVAAVVVPNVLSRPGGPVEATAVVPPRSFKPIELPRGPAPRVLYAESIFESGGGFLHDGEVQVPIPRGWRFQPYGRVPGGWLLVIAESHDFADNRPHHGGVGIYTRNGDWTRLGDAAEWNATLSPDGTQAAFLGYGPGRTSVIVVDLATNRRIATRPATALLGWNPDGVWFRTTSTFVWRPGTAPRPVQDAGLMEIRRRTTLVTEHTDGCVTIAAVLSDGRLARGSRQCGDGVLSPSGRYLVLPPAAARAISRADLTRLPIADSISDAVWEDDHTVLLHVSSGDAFSAREVVIRCDLSGKRCELAYDSIISGTSGVPRLALHEP
jgi:DNA-directed RNA polymerase specialized sigma24 family protein